MKLTIPPQFKGNPGTLLRQAGYHPILDKRGNDGAGKESWVRQLGNARYPRFHLYIKHSGTTTQIDLHLDQKQSTINAPGLKRHAGEYDGDTVEQEMERIKRWIVQVHLG